MESIAEMERCMGDYVVTYWIPMENGGFLKQVVWNRLYIDLGMELSTLQGSKPCKF